MHRAISQGYWWPYMQVDALKYVWECDKCQRFVPMIHQSARELNPLSSPWPFCPVGIRYNRAPSSGSRKQEIFYSSNRLLHKMGRG